MSTAGTTPKTPDERQAAHAHALKDGLKLRRANAVIALLALLALIFHASTMGFSLWTGWYNRDVSVGSAWAIGALVVLHVILVLVLFFFFAEGGSATFEREPHAIMIQRVSAICILVLLHFHIEAYQAVAMGAKLTGWEFAWDAGTELAFFGFVMMHVAVSVAPGLATLGWVRKPKTIRRIDLACYWICGICFALFTGGMLHFYLHALV